jgi:predicted phosphodiesterase
VLRTRRFFSLLALLIPFFAEGSASADSPLTRGPFLQRPDDRTISVLWGTSTAVVGSVAFRLPGAAWQSVSETAPAESHRIALSGLDPGVEYEYQILGDDTPLSPVFQFRAPRAPEDGKLSFGVIGDTAGVEIPAAIAAELAGTGVDLVLHAGDVIYPDGRAEYYDPGFFVPWAPLLARAPVLPVLGDHDVRTNNAAPFFEVFDLPSNGVTGQPRFYSFRQGDAEFFCLDVESSRYGKGSPQYRWLEEGLRESTATWKFVIVFEPPFTSLHSNIIERLTLTPLFERYGVDIVFSGHEHLYERSQPIRLFGKKGKPVTYVVEGGGGAALSNFDPENFTAIVASIHGYVTVTIEEGALFLEAHELGGGVVDSFSLQKPPGAPALPPVRFSPRSPIEDRDRPSRLP